MAEDKAMKKRVLPIGVTCALCALFTGCSAGLKYDHADQYVMGGTTLSGAVTALDVHWISGEVNVVYGDVTGVTFSEHSTQPLTAKTSMYYWLDGSVLRIQYAQSTQGCSTVHYPSKALTVTLPYDVELLETEIETVSADITMDGVYTQEAQLNSVSGEIEGSVYGTQDLEVESVSGDVDLYLSRFQEIDVSTVSGNVALSMETAPRTGDVESVSGDVTLYVNADKGYKVSYETVSGRFSAGLTGMIQGKTWTYGDGASVWEVETTSGNIAVQQGTFNG